MTSKDIFGVVEIAGRCQVVDAVPQDACQRKMTFPRQPGSHILSLDSSSFPCHSKVCCPQRSYVFGGKRKPSGFTLAGAFLYPEKGCMWRLSS